MLIIKFLKEASQDATHIFILGDIFDFWFEYKEVIPKGYIRLLGMLAEIADSSIQLEIFTGNHDMWMFDYLEAELNIKIHRSPIFINLSGKEFLIGHGDGLGPGDHFYKVLKWFFSSAFCQKLFAFLHPRIGCGLANYFSKRSRVSHGAEDHIFLGEEEWLVGYCRSILKERHIDYFIFGHRHLPLDVNLGDGARYINTGEWFNTPSYALFDGHDLQLLFFENDTPPPFQYSLI